MFMCYQFRFSELRIPTLSLSIDIQGFLSRENMSDLAWAVKNGDMDQVKELVEGKVAAFFPFFGSA